MAHDLTPEQEKAILSEYYRNMAIKGRENRRRAAIAKGIELSGEKADIDKLSEEEAERFRGIYYGSLGKKGIAKRTENILKRAIREMAKQKTKKKKNEKNGR